MIYNPEVGQEVYCLYWPTETFILSRVRAILQPTERSPYVTLMLEPEDQRAKRWTCPLSRCFTVEEGLALMLLKAAGYQLEELLDEQARQGF